MFIEEIPLRINVKNLKYTNISKYYIKELNDSKKINKYAKLLNTDILSLKDYNQWYHINGKYYYFKECFAFNELFMS